MAKINKFLKILNTILKIVLICFACGFVAYQILYEDRFSKIPEVLSKILKTSMFYVILLFMFLNWILEAVKWKYALKKSERLTFIESIKATLAGVTTSIFMPFRTGEFVGKIFMLKHTTPLKGFLINLVVSSAQLITTLLIGTISFVIFFYFNSFEYPFLSRVLYFILSILFLMLISIITYCFFDLNRLSCKFYRFLILHNKRKPAVYLRILMTYSKSELNVIVILSVIRYFIFTTQYILLLNLFEIHLGYWTLFAIISVIYFVMTVIPSIALAEVGIRGALAVILLLPILVKNGTMFETAEVNIILAATVLWIINLAIPALIGIFGVWDLKFFAGRNKHIK